MNYVLPDDGKLGILIPICLFLQLLTGTPALPVCHLAASEATLAAGAASVLVTSSIALNPAPVLSDAPDPGPSDASLALPQTTGPVPAF